MHLFGIGHYGVLAYSVLQRRWETWIRMAGGAPPRLVLEMVLKQGLARVGIGLGIGLLGSLYFTRYLESQLFDVTASDPWTYAIVFMVLLSVALVASYLPARRAVRVNPIETLRAE